MATTVEDTLDECQPGTRAMQVQDLRAVARELGQTVDEQDLAGMVRQDAWQSAV